MDKIEEEFYEIATREVASHDIRPGVMAKALIEANGNKEAAVLKYISIRVKQLNDEHRRSLNARYKDGSVKILSKIFSVSPYFILALSFVLIWDIFCLIIFSIIDDDFLSQFAALVCLIGFPICFYFLQNILKKVLSRTHH